MKPSGPFVNFSQEKKTMALYIKPKGKNKSEEVRITIGSTNKSNSEESFYIYMDVLDEFAARKETHTLKLSRKELRELIRDFNIIMNN